MGCPSLTPEGFKIQGIPVDKTEPELFSNNEHQSGLILNVKIRCSAWMGGALSSSRLFIKQAYMPLCKSLCWLQ